MGTGALLAIGCLMVHKCHLGFCPAILTNKISDSPVRTLSLRPVGDMARQHGEGLDRGDEADHGADGGLEPRGAEVAAGTCSSTTARSTRRPSRYSASRPSRQVGASPSARARTPSRAPPQGREPWDAARSTALWELAGTTGKSPGEAQISSMGSIGPPFIEVPSRLSDWVVTDGAQVTRPEHRPLPGGDRDRHLPRAGPRSGSPRPSSSRTSLRASRTTSGPSSRRTASAMGLLYDDSTGRLDGGKYPGRVISSTDSAGPGSTISAVDLEEARRRDLLRRDGNRQARRRAT